MTIGTDPKAQAIDELAHDFPGVPTRIIASVLVAYLRMTNSLNEAIEASHERIADACAV